MMKKKNLVVFELLLILLLWALLPAKVWSQSAEQTGKLFEKFLWRAIGPALMGGRTVDIEAVEKQPWIIYAAIGPSGVWKSENAGTTWEPVFFKENTVSVGDIAIAQSSPNIIWAGTGEATCRNSVTIGDGVYKSTDNGKTWTNMGLKDTRHISRILVNRGDPNIVYVAAMGHLWGPNQDRGVYKTIDGGKTWNKVLYINENTGISDLAIDYGNSQVLYAGAYEHRRLPWIYTSGGQGSGLYKSTDGGVTWKKLTKDLPEGVVGRIGLDTSRSNPGVVYALIEHREGSVFRSEDWGESWKRMCSTDRFKQVANRPFYYSQVRVDPNNDKTIYILAMGLTVSRDGGQNFFGIGSGIHSDHHALWIDPGNSLHLLEGNDGGIDISWDGGKTWIDIQAIDAAEVYQVGYDMRDPYYVYCGLQDNNTWGGPSSSLDTAGVLNADWFVINGGDGFFAVPDPTDPNTVYSNYQMNGMSRFDGRINGGKSVRPQASLSEPPYRFNWNSPIHISPHDSNVVYCGAQFLLRSADRGQSWQVASPDLTTNDPSKQKDSGGSITPDNSGAESHATITTIAESPVRKGVIWCGSDDGCVQVTQDEGKTWTNVIKNIKGLPPNIWCSRIEASHFDAGTAYASFDGHQTDDYAPYVFKTTDFGKTWKPIKANLPFGWVRVVREDLKNKNLLFAGTEFGIFASLDGGTSWFSLKNNLPTVTVYDIAIHPRTNDLIIGTHGRGIWIMDDISFLQEMRPEVLAKDSHLFGVSPATAFYMSSIRDPFGKPGFAGKNRPFGLSITIYTKAEPKEQPKAMATNAQGRTIFETKFPKKAGLQRFTWNLMFGPEKDGKKITPSAAIGLLLPLAPPGEYTITLDVDGTKSQAKTAIAPDPRLAMNEDYRALQHEMVAKTMIVTQKMALAVTAARNLRDQIPKLDEGMKKAAPASDALAQAAKAFIEKAEALADEIIPKELLSLNSRQLALRGGSINQILMSLGNSLASFPGLPTATEIRQVGEIEEIVVSWVRRLNELIATDLPKLNEMLKANNVPLLTVPQEIK